MIIISSSIFILVFQLFMAIHYKNYIKPEDIESFVFSETPLYNFELSENDIPNKKNITFFEFKGRTKKERNNTITYDVKSFTKVLRNKFFYEGKDKNYFDYKTSYSVPASKDCPENYKKCGILDSTNSKLCLPNSEVCPLNGFGISSYDNDPNYQGYNKKIAYSSYDSSVYYIYYTNTNYDGPIITEFKLSNGQPCAVSSEKSWFHYYSNEVEKYYNCITKINNNLHSLRFTQVSDVGINIVGLYQDNGLIENPSYSNVASQTVNLYVRNYNEMDEECFEGFLSDLREEKNYYDSIENTVKALGSISVIFTTPLLIFSIGMYYNKLSFIIYTFIVPFYGIISNIIILAITNKKRIRFNCQVEGFNEEIDELISDQYVDNNIVNIVMSSFSLGMNTFILIALVCLKYMKNKNMDTYDTSNVVPPPMTPLQTINPPGNPGAYPPGNGYPNAPILPPDSY